MAVIIWLAVYFVYETLNTLLSIPYNTMASLAASDDRDRRSINSYRSLGVSLGSALGSMAVAPLVKIFGDLRGENAILSPSDAVPLTKTACVLSLIGILGALHHYVTTRERVKPVRQQRVRMKMREAYRYLLSCRSWVLNVVFIVCYSVHMTLILAAINYYAAYIVGSSAATVPMMGLYLIMAVLTSVFTPKIDERLGRKNMMLFAAGILILCKLPFIINPYSTFSVYLNCASNGIGSTIVFIMFNTNRNNISDIVEWQSGRRMDAMVANGDNLVSKLSQAGATQLIAFALAAAGFSESLKMGQTPATIGTINALLGWVPLAVNIVMLAAVFLMDIEKEAAQEKQAWEERTAEAE